MLKSTLFIIPLFALAFLLVSCSPKAAPQPTDTPPPPDAMIQSSSTATATDSMVSSSPNVAGKYNWDGVVLSGKHHVVLQTSKGNITLELDADAAPKTVTNFITLAKAGYYDNLNFHRVIPDFMIQGGDPKGDGTGGESIYGAKFEDEINAKSYGLDKKTVKEVAGTQPVPPDIADLTVEQLYTQQDGYVYNTALNSLPMKAGAVAMANAGPGTNASQFFIVQAAKGTTWLEGRHTVFGNVMDGMDVVNAIVKVDRDANDKPKTPVMFKVEVID